MCNTIIWSMGAFLIPLSLGCIGLGLQYASQRFFFALASIVLYGIWVFISALYRSSAFNARIVLMNIEEAWAVPDGMGVFRMQGQTWRRLFGVQVGALILLVCLWILLLLLVDQPQGINL